MAGRPVRRRAAASSSASSCAAGSAPGCSRRTSCSSCCGAAASAAAAGCIFEFHGDGRRDAERDRPRDDLQHGDGDRRDDRASSRATSRHARGSRRRAARTTGVELAADPGAVYDEAETIDLGALEPLIALPSSPGRTSCRSARLPGTATRQVCVGSSVNSSFEDLAIVAAVLRGRSLPAELDLTRHARLAPDPRHDRPLAACTPTCSAPGARILEPACGPCIGMGQAPAAGAVSVRTFNRNFPGRSGTAERPGLPLLARDRGGDGAARA